MKKTTSPKRIQLKKIICILFFIFILFISNCSKKTDKDKIMETINTIADLAEDRDLDELLRYLSDDYYDDEERDFNDIEDLVKKYFKRYRGIVIKIIKTKIIEIKTPDAIIETDISISSGAAKLLRKLARLTQFTYRFKVSLKKENEIWKVIKVSWAYIPSDMPISGIN